MAVASETLVWFLGAMIVLLVAAWVVLAMVKYRYSIGSRTLAPAARKKAVVTNPWAEAGRRLEVEPAPPSDGDEPDAETGRPS